MVLETGKHLSELKDRVTSPAGTTIAGRYTLESGGLRDLMMEAVHQAAKGARSACQACKARVKFLSSYVSPR